MTFKDIVVHQGEDAHSDRRLTASLNFARQFNARLTGVYVLSYQTIPGLVRSIGLPKEDLCMACLNRDYPTPMGKELIKIALDNFRKGKKETKRIYETAVKCGC